MEPPSVRMDSFKRIQGAFLVIGSKNYPIFKGVNTVGRNKVATVNIKHLNVSQNQAIIVLVDDNQHYVSDLNSSNGTFLHNSKLIPYKLYELMNGAEIKFGDVLAVYSKIPRNTRLNLQQTLDTAEMTQDMTQNFYASNTQLIFNKKDLSDHSYFNAETSNGSLLNIHEEATQVVDNPLHLPNTQLMDNNTQNQLESSVVLEERVDDIHDAPTQVVCMHTDNCPKEQNIEKESSQISGNSNYNKDIHEAPTQVVVFSENKETEKLSSQSGSSTEKLNTQELIQAINVTINSDDSHTQELTTQEKQDLIDRIEKKNDDSKAEVVEVESNEDIQKSSSLETVGFNKNSILTPFKKKNVIHDSQPPSTSKAFPNYEYDESFLNASKISKGVIEETIIENPDSNDSIDFLELPNMENDVLSKNLKINSGVDKLVTSENTQLTTDSEEIGFRKRSTKPIQSHESDSETDVDDTESIGFRKNPVKQLSTQDSALTDIDDEEKIGFRKKSVRQLLSQDSETDTESQQIGVKKRPVKPLADSVSDTDSETDCEDEILKKLDDNKVSKDDVCIHNQNEMNDSDCIPATQDAFAEALGYEPQYTNQSSEESFKLGLTELMDYSETGTEKNIDETFGDKMYLMPTQKIGENKSVSKKFTFKNKSCPLDESLTTILNNNKNIVVEGDVDESGDAFLQPTQKICTENQKADDVFLQPTQKIVADASEQPEDDIFLQPTQKLDSDNILEKPRTSDGVFLQPGKPIKKKVIKISAELEKIDEDSDDVFLQPTQKLVLEEPVEVAAGKDVFIEPSDPLNFKKGSSKITNTQDDDIYNMATQVIQEDTNKKTEDIPMTQEDLYCQATQKLNPASQEPDTVTQNQDVYDVATQQIDDVSNVQADKISNQLITDPNLGDTQLEMPFSSQTTHFKVAEESNRPGNPILRELDHLPQQDEEADSSSLFKEPLTIRDNINSKADDPETLSNTETFIEKPLPPTATRRSVRKSNLDKKDEAPETLSQIEAFVKTPALNKLSNEVPPETLSQIATFISSSSPKIQDLTKKDEIEIVSRKPSKCVSSNSTSVSNDTTINNLRVIRADEEEGQSSSKSSDETNDSERSLELKSDVDQSFALLENKTSKIRRKHKNDPILEIKVNVTSHRRSMGVAENLTPNIVIPIKKTLPNKTNISDDSSIEEPAKTRNRGRPQKPSISKEPEKRTSVRGKKIEETEDSDTGDGHSKVSTKPSATRKSSKVSVSSEPEPVPVPRPSGTRKSRKASTSSEPEPVPRKSRKLSINNEHEGLSARGIKGEALDTITEESKQTSASNKRKIENENIEVPKSSIRISIQKTVDPINDNEKNNTSSAALKSTKAGSKPHVLEINEEDGKEESKRGSKSEDTVSKRNVKKQPPNLKEIENISKTGKRRTSDSSESDFVTSGPSTPAKRGRMGAKVSNAPSKDTSGKSRDSSTSSDSMATPRKGRNPVKTESLLASAERSKRKQKPKVVFTMLDSPQLESYIKHLGGSIVDKVDSCTVLVTQSVKRSQKLLTAVGQGKPICSPEWIRASKQNNEFLDPWDYLLVDKEAEKKWDFSLRESLIRACDNKLLQGYIFQVMVTNALDVLKGAIEASGGKIVTKQPGKSEMNSFIIIATKDQKSKFQRIQKQHPDVKVAEPEAIFDGVLRQEFRLSRHLIE